MPNVDDLRHMSRAIELAGRGLYTTDPNPRVGCVIARDGQVIGEGWHQRAGGPHAEIHALEQAGSDAAGATVYISLEPCCHHGRTPPCTRALIEAGAARVVVAMLDPNPRVAGQGLAELKAAGIEVEAGVLRAESEALNPGFIMRMQRSRPFVRCKLAMSLDGRTAMASGESQWITGTAARRDVHRLRARSSAIVTGAGTVLNDDPSLNARLEGLGRDAVVQPLRVVLDTHLAMPAGARMLQLPGETLVLTANAEAGPRAALERAGAQVEVVSVRDGELDLGATMDALAAREVNEVLLETGAVLAGAMLRAGLIDELVIYMAPHLMGDGARGLFHLPGLARMADRIELQISDIRALGADWRITARVRQAVP